MYVWRLPLVYFAILITTAALVLVVSVVVGARNRTASSVLRGILTSSAILAFLASPALVQAIADREFRKLIQLGMFAHHGWQVFIAPAVAAGVLLVICRVLFPYRSSSTLKWRVRYWAVSLAFVVLNLANWCSPGWCERFGFPFSYSWWSDSILIVNGENLSADTSTLAAAGNAFVFLGIVVVMSRLFFRGSYPLPSRP